MQLMWARTYTHARTHARTLACTHTCTCAHAHTHTSLQAFLQGKLYPRYAWITPGWYRREWWRGEGEEGVCNDTAIEAVLRTSLAFFHHGIVNGSELTDTGIVSEELLPDTHIHTHACLLTLTHICSTHAYVHSRTHPHACTHTRTHAHACIHTRTHTHKHTHTHSTNTQLTTSQYVPIACMCTVALVDLTHY